MALLLAPDVYARLEERFGKAEAREIVKALDGAVQTVDKKADEAVQRIEHKADALIVQKKFELKDELTKELATKAEIVELKGLIKTEIVTLDRKFTIMFLILFFTTIFVNQNALKFIAELLGIIKP
jgi:hypothetical protein